MASSRFHEHFSDTSSDVHARPPSLIDCRHLGYRERVWSRISERSESVQKRPTSTLNCNGLAFRRTTFVPDPDMVHITFGAGSKAPSGERKGHRRNKTPTTLAALAGFYLVPYALRKAAVSSRERLEKKERKKQTCENTTLATGCHDPAIGSNPRIATPSLGNTLDIEVPQLFGHTRDSSGSDVSYVSTIDDGHENWEGAAEFGSPVDTGSSLSSVCTGERVQMIGTRLSDLQEESEISETVPGEVFAPMPSGGTIMLVRGWSSSSGEEELSPGPPKRKGRRTWMEV